MCLYILSLDSISHSQMIVCGRHKVGLATFDEVNNRAAIKLYLICELQLRLCRQLHARMSCPSSLLIDLHWNSMILMFAGTYFVGSVLEPLQPLSLDQIAMKD